MKVLIIIFSLIPFFGISQSRIITARIIDRETRLPIRYATVTINKDDSTVFSNHLGYFQASLTSSDKLLISHIGYMTSEIQIPESDSFVVLLEKQYTKLSSLELSSFPLQTTLTTLHIDNDISRIGNSAIYKDNWQKFYEDLGELIVKSPSYNKVDSVFEVRVLFTINESSQVENISILDLSLPLNEKELIKESLLSLKNWTPATQNENKTSQFFELVISRNMEAFIAVEEIAYPAGGLKSFSQYIKKNLQYPVEASLMGVEGTVFVEFIVEKDGKLTSINIVKGIGAGCDREAIRLIQQCPNWNPGLQRGKPVRIRMTLPITFALDNPHNFNSKISLSEYLGYNLRYPSKARIMGLEGTIYATFEVDEGNSSFSNVQILNNIGGECGEEIMRVLRITPTSIVAKFAPDKTYILPVTFGIGTAPLRKKEIKLPEGKLLDELVVIAKAASSSAPVNLNRIGSENYRSIEDAISKNINIQRLSLSNKGLTELSSRISELVKLKFLDVEKNNISELPTEITKLPKLEELYLPFNKVSSLPSGFSNLQSLKIIGLAENELKVFPIELTKLIKLEALDLSNNEISEIPSEIVNLKKLKLLILNTTKLKTLPKEIYELKKLEKIYLIDTLITKQEAEDIQSQFKKTAVIIE